MTDGPASTCHPGFLPPPRSKEPGLAVVGTNPPVAASDYSPDPPSLACHHCGATIGLAEWPPFEPLLSGPCPGCGGWLVVDFRKPGFGQREPEPTRSDQNLKQADGAADEHLEPEPLRAAPRIVRSGSFEPQFLPDLEAAGLMPQPWQPDFEKSEASSERVLGKYYFDRWMKFWGLAAALVALIAGGLVLRQYLRSKPGLSAVRIVDGTSPPPDHGEETFPLPDEMAAEARETLRAIAAARTPKELLKWVLDPERIAPQVISYYHRGVDEPALAAGDFEARPVSLRDRRQGIAVLSRPNPNGSPVIVVLKKDMTGEEAPYRLDWETYLQEKEGLLPRFAADPAEQEGTFRVVLLRQHLFNGEDVSLGRMGLTLGTLTGVRLDRPVVIGPSEKVYDRLERQLPWDQPQIATVRLGWTRFSSDEDLRLTIKEFLCWEVAGVGGVPEAPLTPAYTLAGAR